uniref:KRAB domain-containing protein n=1 Tax=Anas platyrhynchos TaxID=8839 RepID=A0A8B9T527_ANAPL
MLPAFEDVAVFLSRAEWELAAEEQRELYRAVMLDNFALLTSLGEAGRPAPGMGTSGGAVTRHRGCSGVGGLGRIHPSGSAASPRVLVWFCPGSSTKKGQNVLSLPC